jgi:hypothetical protein
MPRIQFLPDDKEIEANMTKPYSRQLCEQRFPWLIFVPGMPGALHVE